MLYHLSIDKNLTELTPKIPECAIASIEDTITERICFSDNIEGCLSALQDAPRKYYVYVPKDKVSESEIYHPSVLEVRDAKFTHEVWLKTPTKVKCIGVIESSQWDWSKRHRTKNGFTTFFHYPYKWLSNLEEQV